MESMNGENIEKPISTQEPVTPFDIEWTHHYITIHKTTSIDKVLELFIFKHAKGMRGRLHTWYPLNEMHSTLSIVAYILKSQNKCYGNPMLVVHIELFV